VIREIAFFEADLGQNTRYFIINPGLLCDLSDSSIHTTIPKWDEIMLFKTPVKQIVSEDSSNSVGSVNRFL
jgi:hypothetical protein